MPAGKVGDVKNIAYKKRGGTQMKLNFKINEHNIQTISAIAEAKTQLKSNGLMLSGYDAAFVTKDYDQDSFTHRVQLGAYKKVHSEEEIREVMADLFSKHQGANHVTLHTLYYNVDEDNDTEDYETTHVEISASTDNNNHRLYYSEEAQLELADVLRENGPDCARTLLKRFMKDNHTICFRNEITSTDDLRVSHYRITAAFSPDLNVDATFTDRLASKLSSEKLQVDWIEASDNEVEINCINTMREVLTTIGSSSFHLDWELGMRIGSKLEKVYGLTDYGIEFVVSN